MITIKLGKHTHFMQTKWSEFTPEDGDKFIELSQAAGDFESGKISYEQLQVSAVLILLGLQKATAEDKGYKLENIYRLTKYTDTLFPVKRTDEGRYSWADVVFTENLLPEVGKMIGYRFRIHDGGVVDCDITAEQYVDVLGLVEAYGKDFSPFTLTKICQCLYGCHPYDPSKSYDVELHFREATKMAIYYNIRGILEFIKRIPAYDIIFNGNGKKGKGPESPLGLTGSIFAIAKAGYGDIESIRRLDMFSYLGILAQMTADTIRTYSANKLKPGEIADRLGLTLEQVLPFITE